ncbi:PIG-L deacetylase family protein [Ornithinimicrobium sp. LYQ103]|uniref:PIG-L deacetylase family protein n=1 Tax=Ornithinimicrobium sp. LYQ103 TaxID=3378796 RepID=UPI003853615D
MPRSVVVLAPHCDDETLGAGGAIRRHVEEGDDVRVVVATGGSGLTHPLFTSAQLATVQDEARAAMRVLNVPEPFIMDLEPVTYPDGARFEINRAVHEVLDQLAPEVLYVPFPYDLHNDHRALFHAASVAWRPSTTLGRSIKTILAYEVVSETHWQATAFEPAFAPTVWRRLTEEQLASKLDALLCYHSQMADFPATRSLEAVEHLARWRGSQVGVAAAEAFVLVRELG